MARRSDHNRDELRELILKAAREIVINEGFSNLSARKISNKIGYTVGTLYNVFKDLNEIVFYINAKTLDMLFEFLESEVKQEKNPEKIILKIGNGYINFCTKNSNLSQMLYEHHLPRPKGEKLPEWYQEKIEKNFLILESAFLKITPSKKLATRLTKVLWASLQGISTLSILGKLNTTESESASILTETLIKTIISGVKRD